MGPSQHLAHRFVQCAFLAQSKHQLPLLASPPLTPPPPNFPLITPTNPTSSDAKKTGRIALSFEILLLLEQLPVTLSILKQGTMGKVVKSLNKEGTDAKVRGLADKLVEKWMKLVKDTPNSKKKKDGKKDVNGAKKSKAQLGETC